MIEIKANEISYYLQLIEILFMQAERDESLKQIPSTYPFLFKLIQDTMFYKMDMKIRKKSFQMYVKYLKENNCENIIDIVFLIIILDLTIFDPINSDKQRQINTFLRYDASALEDKVNETRINETTFFVTNIFSGVFRDDEDFYTLKPLFKSLLVVTYPKLLNDIPDFLPFDKTKLPTLFFETNI